jgi:hypothetical protein
LAEKGVYLGLGEEARSRVAYPGHWEFGPHRESSRVNSKRKCAAEDTHLVLDGLRCSTLGESALDVAGYGVAGDVERAGVGWKVVAQPSNWRTALSALELVVLA